MWRKFIVVVVCLMGAGVVLAGDQQPPPKQDDSTVKVWLVTHRDFPGGPIQTADYGDNEDLAKRAAKALQETRGMNNEPLYFDVQLINPDVPVSPSTFSKPLKGQSADESPSSGGIAGRPGGTGNPSDNPGVVSRPTIPADQLVDPKFLQNLGDKAEQRSRDAAAAEEQSKRLADIRKAVSDYNRIKASYDKESKQINNDRTALENRKPGMSTADYDRAVQLLEQREIDNKKVGLDLEIRKTGLKWSKELVPAGAGSPRIGFDDNAPQSKIQPSDPRPSQKTQKATGPDIEQRRQREEAAKKLLKSAQAEKERQAAVAAEQQRQYQQKYQKYLQDYQQYQQQQAAAAQRQYQQQLQQYRQQQAAVAAELYRQQQAAAAAEQYRQQQAAAAAEQYRQQQAASAPSASSDDGSYLRMLRENSDMTPEAIRAMGGNP